MLAYLARELLQPWHRLRELGHELVHPGLAEGVRREHETRPPRQRVRALAARRDVARHHHTVAMLGAKSRDLVGEGAHVRIVELW